MKNIRLLMLLTVILIMTACSAKGQPEGEKGERIIATTVALMDTAAKLNIELAGIPTTSKDIPLMYKDVPEIGAPKKPNMERLQSLNATDVLSVTTIKPEMDKAMKGSNIPTTFYDYNSIAAMQKSITAMGKDFNRQQEAAKLNKIYDDKIAAIHKRIAGQKKPKVIILLGVPGSYLISTEKSFYGNLVELAGGINVVKANQSDEEFIASNTESLYKLQPDIILRASHGFPKQVKTMFDEEFKTNDVWKNFEATKAGRVYDLDENLFGITANINADEALEELYKLLYKE
ncbi:heme ABC transporter substrate-binding protein IsdE [Kurthia sibirica]|uniref:High-affinity heme uptake system protein IsdE n=1 Tax=Kurthia sibirica TaxID=202750 RepID=A0A2U3AIN6_9BACL|nr:heme ABC transporter substrate-binding protein IsdE [Kurthia sibirica]PWI24416.1 heme ABC transporter substrate-binding protein IsdE [Kurthia sibirica]GEK33834.1 high-affinity heme uptake system protein IsdE [Kurthia sibirica]